MPAALASLPVPRLQLIQVGNYKTPRLDFSTRVEPETKIATTPIYRGPEFFFDHARRGDINKISVSHSGMYECCDDKPGCLWALSEWDGIVRAYNVRTPMLFYRTAYCLDCPCECKIVGEKCWSCLSKEPCGEWLWAWGYVTRLENYNSAEDWKRPSVAQVSLEILLEGPLRRATHQNWFYGVEPRPIEKCKTLQMALSEMDIAKKYYMPPCGPGRCCSRFRFFYRDTAAACTYECPQYFDSFSCPLLWPIEKKYTINADCLRIFIPGHTAPRVIATFESYQSVRVQNSLFDITIAPGMLGQSYSDTDTGLVYNNYGGWVFQPTALDLVRLEPGENVVTSTGSLTLGVLPYWVN